MANTKISAFPVVTTTINTTDKFLFNSGGTTSITSFQTIINNLASSYQPLNANLTQISNGTAPTQSGLDLLALPTPTSHSYISISAGTGAINRRRYGQVLSDIGAQAADATLTALVDNGTPSTAGKKILIIATPSSAGYVNVAATGSAAQVDNYNVTATNLRPYIIPPAVTKATSATTTWTIDYGSSENWVLTALAGAITISNPNTASRQTDGSLLYMRLKDNGSRRNLTFDTKYKATSACALPTQTANGTLYLTFIYNSDADEWHLILNTYAS